jgi:hypothetical protein
MMDEKEKTMKRRSIRLFGVSILAIALTAGLILTFSKESTKAKISTSARKEQRLVAHEWGTFTSIAGEDGVAIEWRPLNGASDLPKFVYSLTSENAEQGLRGLQKKTETGKPQTGTETNKPQTGTETRRPPQGGKGLPSTIRMETPVIYFYTDEEMDVSVKVDFPKGRVTEWYPRALAVNKQTDRISEANHTVANGDVDWGKFRLVPNASPFYLKEAADSHYYPARETDAVPICVYGENDRVVEWEKFLFYRGIGRFDLPLTVKLDGDNLTLGNRGVEPISNLIVFENNGGKIGFKRVGEVSKGTTSVARPALKQSLEELLTDLESLLVSQGLYEKEAKAMIKTWRDSWFEEGLRVFYVLPPKMTDTILPLTIDPKPQELVRVLVGRTELITPEMEQNVKTQVGFLSSPSKQVREKALMTLQKYGRFYEPILKSILQKETDVKVQKQIRKLLETTT